MSLQISIANTLGGKGSGGNVVTTPHISEWRTTEPNETVTLPYTTTGTYTGLIDWGDGTQSINSYENRTHTYATAGYYEITINGSIRGFRFDNSGDRTKIYTIFQWGSQFNLGQGASQFFGCTNLNLSVVNDVLQVNAPGLPLDQQTRNFTNMFRNCTSLFSCFAFCPNFNGNIGGWNVSQVTVMQSVFNGASSFNQNLESWDVRNVTTMFAMFQNASLFNQNISSWNVRNVINMNLMFRGASLFDQPLANWERTTPDISSLSNVTNMTQMFNFNTVFNQPLNNWNVGSVTTFREMFYGATQFNQPLNSWNVLTATDMLQMFRQATNFNQNIGNWDIRNVTNFTNFMSQKTLANYSTANYDALLIGWASRPVQPGIFINFGTIKRTVASLPAYTILTVGNGWSIQDGGI
jgi:surface protein